MTIINSLVPDLSPDRTATLTPLLARRDAAHAALTAARGLWADVVERLARVDMVKLRPRLRKEFYTTVGSVRATAVELRAVFDNCDVPADLRDVVRAAMGASTDKEFTSVVQRIVRDLDRYCGLVEHVDVLVRRLAVALAELDAAGDSIFSDAFVVPPRQEFGWVAAK